MCTRWSRVLAPLTTITSIQIKCKRKNVEKYAFDAIQRIMARHTILNYLDFNETLQIHTDSSALQLGPIISHKVKQIYFVQ